MTAAHDAIGNALGNYVAVHQAAKDAAARLAEERGDDVAVDEKGDVNAKRS